MQILIYILENNVFGCSKTFIIFCFVMVMGLTSKQQSDAGRLFKKLGSAAAVSKEIGAGVDRVRNFLHREGYELKQGGRRVASNGGRGALSEDEIKKVLGKYKTFHGCSGCASRDSYSRDTFNTYWYLAGLPKISHEVAHFDPITVTNRHLERAYKQYERMLNGSIKTPVPIIKVREEIVEEEKRKPSEKRGDRRYRGEETKLEIISAYDRYNGDVKLAAGSMLYGKETIRKCWADFKIEAREAHTLYRGNSVRVARELKYPEREILRVWSDLGLSSGKGTSGLERKVG